MDSPGGSVNLEALGTLEQGLSLLSPELQQLIIDAEEQAWPFVPEKWQFTEGAADANVKQTLTVKDLILAKSQLWPDTTHKDILIECLGIALRQEHYSKAAAILFLLDRFMYWKGGTSELLEKVKLIESACAVPIAPQVIIRKARFLKDSGAIQDAEKVLDNLLANIGKDGAWQYKTRDQLQIVKATCTQIKGLINFTIGLWIDAGRLILKSIVMYHSLEKPDWKGISSSQGIMSDILRKIPPGYPQLKEEFQLQEDSPLLEAYNNNKHAAWLSRSETLFLARHLRRAGEVMLMYAAFHPLNDTSRRTAVDKAISDFRTSLKAHRNLNSLSSKEQMFEFISSLLHLSMALSMTGLPHQARTGQQIELLCMDLYDFYCTTGDKVIIDDTFCRLVNTSLQLIGLEALPQNTIGTAGQHLVVEQYPFTFPTYKESPEIQEKESHQDNLKVCSHIDNKSGSMNPSNEDLNLRKLQNTNCRENIKLEPTTIDLPFAVTEQSDIKSGSHEAQDIADPSATTEDGTSTSLNLKHMNETDLAPKDNQLNTLTYERRTDVQETSDISDSSNVELINDQMTQKEGFALDSDCHETEESGYTSFTAESDLSLPAHGYGTHESNVQYMSDVKLLPFSSKHDSSTYGTEESGFSTMSTEEMSPFDESEENAAREYSLDFYEAAITQPEAESGGSPGNMGYTDRPIATLLQNNTQLLEPLGYLLRPPVEVMMEGTGINTCRADQRDIIQVNTSVPDSYDRMVDSRYANLQRTAESTVEYSFEEVLYDAKEIMQSEEASSISSEKQPSNQVDPSATTVCTVESVTEEDILQDHSVLPDIPAGSTASLYTDQKLQHGTIGVAEACAAFPPENLSVEKSFKYVDPSATTVGTEESPIAEEELHQGLAGITEGSARSMPATHKVEKPLTEVDSSATTVGTEESPETEEELHQGRAGITEGSVRSMPATHKVGKSLTEVDSSATTVGTEESPVTEEELGLDLIGNTEGPVRSMPANLKERKSFTEVNSSATTVGTEEAPSTNEELHGDIIGMAGGLVVSPSSNSDKSTSSKYVDPSAITIGSEESGPTEEELCCDPNEIQQISGSAPVIHGAVNKKTTVDPSATTICTVDSSDTDSGTPKTHLHENTQYSMHTQPEPIEENNLLTVSTLSSGFESHAKKSTDTECTASLMTELEPNSTRVKKARVFRYEPQRNVWNYYSTLIYNGEELELEERKKGKQRNAFWVNYIHQEETRGRYVGKRYKKDKPIIQYHQDVYSQMTARHYVTLFNQRLHRLPAITGRIQFLPVVHIQILSPSNQVIDVLNVEPYIDGDFIKLTNNLNFRDVQLEDGMATAFTHFTYQESGGTLMVVDLQGWVPKAGGPIILTDPQIHSTTLHCFGSGNLGKRGFQAFWEKQHPKCNHICGKLGLRRPLSSK